MFGNLYAHNKHGENEIFRIENVVRMQRKWFDYLNKNNDAHLVDVLNWCLHLTSNYAEHMTSSNGSNLRIKRHYNAKLNSTKLNTQKMIKNGIIVHHLNEVSLVTVWGVASLISHHFYLHKLLVYQIANKIKYASNSCREQLISYLNLDSFSRKHRHKYHQWNKYTFDREFTEKHFCESALVFFFSFIYALHYHSPDHFDWSVEL